MCAPNRVCSVRFGPVLKLTIMPDPLLSFVPRAMLAAGGILPVLGDDMSRVGIAIYLPHVIP